MDYTIKQSDIIELLNNKTINNKSFENKMNELFYKNILKLDNSPFKFSNSNITHLIKYIEELKYYQIGIIINDNNLDLMKYHINGNNYSINENKIKIILNKNNIIIFYKEK